MNWAILVVWMNGEEEYVKQGIGTEIARFTKRQAQEQREFLWMGMEGDPDVQSVNVVRYPSRRKTKAA